MPKSQEMIDFLNSMTEEIFGKSRSDCLEDNTCVTCGSKVSCFRDAISKKEYGISGMCQSCQDLSFGKGDDD